MALESQYRTEKTIATRS